MLHATCYMLHVFGSFEARIQGVLDRCLELALAGEKLCFGGFLRHLDAAARCGWAHS